MGDIKPNTFFGDEGRIRELESIRRAFEKEYMETLPSGKVKQTAVLLNKARAFFSASKPENNGDQIRRHYRDKFAKSL